MNHVLIQFLLTGLTHLRHVQPTVFFRSQTVWLVAFGTGYAGYLAMDQIVHHQDSRDGDEDRFIVQYLDKCDDPHHGDDGGWNHDAIGLTF